MPKVAQRAVAEFIGTAVLVCVVVGSGIMGANLSQDTGVALLINTFSTIFALSLLILVFAPISGAHFNPAVTLVQFISRSQPLRESVSYVLAQIAGGVAGAIIANLMFDLPAIEISGHSRVTNGMLVGEVIATAGLIIVIGVLVYRGLNAVVPAAVAAWIGSAYFFTSSTSFANPAVTIGRMFSDTFAGISPDSVLPYIAAQLAGATIGLFLVRVINSQTSLTNTK